ncbi:MAG: hypothetical protein K8U57_02230 [Planctomycetes bacterium]|nr:hypothetical protein [Planctomycetota bacterium]
MAKADFPPELLVGVGGVVTGASGQFDITLSLQPFTYDGELVDQALVFRRVKMQASRVEELAGRSFEFPVNPSPGYVESSVYLWSAHNPVDVRRITFGSMNGDVIAAEFALRFVFDYEGSCKPLDKVLRAELQVRSG